MTRNDVSRGVKMFHYVFPYLFSTIFISAFELIYISKLISHVPMTSLSQHIFPSFLRWWEFWGPQIMMKNQPPSHSAWPVRAPTSPSKTMAVSPCVLWAYIYLFLVCLSVRWEKLDLGIVAMQQLKLHLHRTILVLKFDPILTSQSMRCFSKPLGESEVAA